ncbi:MAG TPA: RNA methyltransferase PUA domain-containing protein, partial [Wenzhouxiangella sp.]|nr:RNA methyltransferase PUA domain-containing protein [Wenzhouxiangella sp.]
MRRIRIYTEQMLAAGREVELEPGPARHLVRVLRQKSGHRLALFNGDGHEYFGTIAATGPGDRCSVAVEQRIEVATESLLTISLVQAIARNFGKAAKQNGVERIIYLGGLGNQEDDLPGKRP